MFTPFRWRSSDSAVLKPSFGNENIILFWSIQYSYNNTRIIPYLTLADVRKGSFCILRFLFTILSLGGVILNTDKTTDYIRVTTLLLNGVPSSKYLQTVYLHCVRTLNSDVRPVGLLLCKIKRRKSSLQTLSEPVCSRVN